MLTTRRRFIRSLGAATVAGATARIPAAAQTASRGPERASFLATYYRDYVLQLQQTLGPVQLRQMLVDQVLAAPATVSMASALEEALPADLQRVPLFMQRLQREGRGVVDGGLRAHLTDTRLGSGWGSSAYHGSVDLRGRHRIGEWEIEFGRQILELAVGQPVDHPRPLLLSAYDASYQGNGHLPVCGDSGVVTDPSWASAQGLPVRGLYSSTSLETHRDQLIEAHTTGIDVMAVSSLETGPFIEGATQLASRSLPPFTRFFWLYEHIDPDTPGRGLPLDVENLLPVIDFGRADVQEQFIADMLRLAGHFDRANYFTIERGETVYYPVWMWLSHAVRNADAFVGTVQTARDVVRARYGRELALIGGEPVQFPSASVETLNRLRAFFAVTSYGIYTPYHSEVFALELDTGYQTLTVNNILRWFDIIDTAGIETIYGGASPEYWPPSQFSFSDNAGNPPLISTTEHVERFLELLQRRVIAPRRPRFVNHTSYNEHRVGSGVEPTFARPQAIGQFDLCQSGYNGAWDDLRSVLKYFGPSLFYREAKLPALATGGERSLF